MSTPRDDDALSWDGDDDPTLDVGEKRIAEAEPEPLQPAPRPVEPAPAPTASAARHPDPDVAVEAVDEADAERSAPLGNVGLVGIGMVAAAFLLFAVGWLLAGLRLRGLGLPIPEVTVLSLTVAASLAPLVWFVAVLALTRAWRTWQRFLLLILGVVLLVPWPFLSSGTFA